MENKSHVVAECLLVFVSFPPLNHPVLGEKVGCVTQCWVRRWGVSSGVGREGRVCSCFPTPLHTVIQVQCWPPVRQHRSNLEDINSGVCHVMKITKSESNPDRECAHMARQTFCF